MKKILIVLSLLFASVAYADHENVEADAYFQQIPALCSTPEKMQAYIEHLKMKPYHLSLGREGMDPEGQPVFMVTYYVNEEGTSSAALIDVPSGLETCMLFQTFDLTKPKQN